MQTEITRFVAEHGAVGVPPPDRVLAVVLLEIALPELLAVEIVGRQVAVAEMDDDHLAVGHRRGAGEVVIAVELLVAGGRSPCLAMTGGRLGRAAARPFAATRSCPSAC